MVKFAEIGLLAGLEAKVLIYIEMKNIFCKSNANK